MILLQRKKWGSQICIFKVVKAISDSETVIAKSLIALYNVFSFIILN